MGTRELTHKYWNTLPQEKRLEIIKQVKLLSNLSPDILEEYSLMFISSYTKEEVWWKILTSEVKMYRDSSGIKFKK